MPIYFWTVVLLFWVPGVALIWGRWKSLTRTQRFAFWTTVGLMTVVSGLMEYVYLKADIWNFSQAVDPLLGIRIFGAPIEEFVYWFGATPFVLGIYLLIRPVRHVRLVKSGRRGLRRGPA